MYTLIKIAPFDNGSHDNIVVDSYDEMPDGWALLPDSLPCPGFPFGTIETAKIDGVTTVTTWDEDPVPAALTQQDFLERKEYAYHNRRCIMWEGYPDKMITVVEATHFWLRCAASGDTYHADMLTSLIKEAKDAIEKDYK